MISDCLLARAVLVRWLGGLYNSLAIPFFFTKNEKDSRMSIKILPISQYGVCGFLTRGILDFALALLLLMAGGDTHTVTWYFF